MIIHNNLIEMKAQKQVSGLIPNHSKTQINSIIGYNDLNDSQKKTLFLLYHQGGDNKEKVIISVEDIFQENKRFELMEKKILKSIHYLIANIIPTDIQKN
jgi:hypothetical protein